MKSGFHQVQATGDHVDNEDGDVRFGVSAQGKEQVAVRCQVVGGECDGEVIWWTGSFANAEAVEITVRGLRDLGARLSDGRITDLEGLGSVVVSGSVKEEEWDGKKRFRLSVGGGGFRFKNGLDAGGLAALEARLRGGIVAASQRGAPTRARAAAGKGDDIPF